MRVLISRLSALGDVVCSLPVAGAIKSQWPDAEVSWVVDKRFRGIVECCTAVDGIFEKPGHMEEVRAWGEFDAALDMQGLLKSGLIVGVCRAKKKLGYHWQREGSWLFSGRVLPDPTSIHVVDQYVDVARALGCQTETAEFRLEPKAEDLATVGALLVEKGRDQRPLVLINAGAGWATKRWSPAKYADLTGKLNEAGAQVAVLGAPGDRPVYEELLAHGAKDCLCMVGETNVRQLVALVALAPVHVGGDTGSTHIAAALGRPAIGIYTLTKPERSCPYGQFSNCFAGDPDVESVFTAIMRHLEGAP